MRISRYLIENIWISDVKLIHLTINCIIIGYSIKINMFIYNNTINKDVNNRRNLYEH